MNPVDPARAAAFVPPPFEGGWTPRDSILYALGLGLGHDPLDGNALPFVYEERGPRALPSLVTVVGDPNRWLYEPAAGLGDAPNVHGAQTVTFHAPVPAAGRIRSQSRIAGLYDRGPGSHAILLVEEAMVDAATGAPLATLLQTDVLMGAGGFGGEPPPALERPAMPDRAPDAWVRHPVSPRAALLYRLSGDHVTFHVDPAAARAAGFERPILHGLCTWGMACHAVVATFCGHEPARLRRLHGRFTAPGYPGEALLTELWDEGGGIVLFRTRTQGRDAVLIDNGRADGGEPT